MVDFLDITLNLSTGIYQPYQKPNSTINYIHRKSNHPPPPPHPPIIKNLSKGIELRLSNNSANVKIFNKVTKPYNAALRENGHRQQIKYTKNEEPQEKAAKTNRNHATGEIKTPPNEKRDETKEKKRREQERETSSGSTPQSVSMSPPTSEKCVLDAYTRASQQTTSCTKY